jgi:RNA-directed DNA polymerase
MSLVLTASNEDLREQFFALRTPEDVAKLLDIEYSHLVYHLYVEKRLKQRYKTFSISKRSGGTRKITAPITGLKIIQQKLNQVLQQVYRLKPCVHGFVLERNIVTNAKTHAKQRYIFNVDLKDFFPSINFGRVRGVFQATPYKLDPSVATVLAQICCFDNELPQGAPTSPIVSNMICAKMDSELQQLAKKHRCIYTRYADDITFSTSMPAFPIVLATINSVGQVEVGSELNRIITENGFIINPDKVRLQTKNHRQEVTGLTVNQKPNVRRKYIRQIRAMLYAWEKFGLDDAEAEFLGKYDRKNRSLYKDKPSFKQVVKGKIEFLGMVRGKSDLVYLRFRKQLRSLAPELVKETPTEAEDTARLEELKSLQERLRIHKRNLSTLQEQAALYGMTPPLHLINGIEYEKKAIEELEQCIQDLQGY